MNNDNVLVRIYKNGYIRIMFFGLCLCIVPLLTGLGVLKTSWLGIMGGTIIYTIVALGLNILLGCSGLSSLGTAGFMGLGAYISACVTADLDLPWIVGIFAAVAISTILGVIVGLVSMRLEGLYLGIITLCIAEILKKTFEEFANLTGGFAGKKAAFPSFFGYTLNQSQTYILLAFALVAVMMITHNLMKGQLGRALHAMRGSQIAAQAMGVSIIKYRLIAFALSTAYASLGGALYVHFIKFTYPSTWSLILSLNILAIVIIGGVRSIYGTFIGAVIVYAFPDLVIKKIPVIGSINGIAYIVSGILIIIVVLFYPGGAVNLFVDLRSKLLARRNTAVDRAGDL